MHNRHVNVSIPISVCVCGGGGGVGGGGGHSLRVGYENIPHFTHFPPQKCLSFNVLK